MNHSCRLGVRGILGRRLAADKQFFTLHHKNVDIHIYVIQGQCAPGTSRHARRRFAWSRAMRALNSPFSRRLRHRPRQRAIDSSNVQCRRFRPISNDRRSPSRLLADFLTLPHAPRVVFHVQSVASVRTSRAPLRVVAQRAVTKKVQVVLTQQIPSLGNAGDLKSVPVGHYRNYLQPQGLAMMATEGILEEIQKKQASEERAKLEEKAKAQAMATALSTIGKFIIKKKIGEEDQIFGSVSAVDIVEAIRMQTGRDVEKRNVTVPDIKSLGTYDCTVKLHPEVVGSFKVVVQKDTSN